MFGTAQIIHLIPWDFDIKMYDSIILTRTYHKARLLIAPRARDQNVKILSQSVSEKDFEIKPKQHTLQSYEL